jgi:hypothetical protein
MHQLLLFFCVSCFLFTKTYAMTESEEDIINDTLHPVIKFKRLEIEPILDYKDDQGFAPLKVKASHVRSEYWNMHFDTYHYQFESLFAYELKGHKTHRGIHFPPITRFYQAIIHFNQDEIKVHLANDSFNTIGILGPINLKKQGWNYTEGLTFCHDFLNKYILFDHLYTQFHETVKIPQNKEANIPYWTVVDDYIVKHVINLKSIPTRNGQEDEKPQDEIIRQIGEYFKWRNILVKFIQEVPQKFMNDLVIGRMFERYLIDEIHTPHEIAHQYKKMMNMKNAQVIMLMQTLDPGNAVHLNFIFDQFIKIGLIIPADREKYMDYFA